MANGSGNFAGNAFLSLPTSSAFTFGIGNFTIEGWFRASSYKASQVLFSTTTLYNVLNNVYLLTAGASNNQFSIASNGNILLTSISTFTLNTWYHVAIVKNVSSLRLYVNGNIQATGSNSQSFTSNTPIIGSINGISNAIEGYLSNLRVVKGTAIYTSGFTPPVEPLSAISGTSLLTLQQSTLPFTDASANNFTITNTGNLVTASTLNPFDGVINSKTNFLSLF